MILLLALACTGEPPAPTTTEVDLSWEGVPLQRGRWPAWAGDQAKAEGVATLGDGRRRAHRITAPRPEVVGGDSSWAVQDDLWRARLVPAEGPVQTWEIDLGGEPERVAGAPTRLEPSGGEVVAVVEPATVRGVLALGDQAWGFRCLGVGADLSPDGWCLALLSRVWLETWEEAAGGSGG